MSKEREKWNFRAVQLDLARQMETLDYIFSFIEFAARFNYNKLFLYLEGRVRTDSFPYPKPSQSYTPEEMRKVVSYAVKYGIEVIPVVSNLGHTEQFLQYPQLSDLSELREGIPGRFGNALHCSCPSLEKPFSFFRKYYKEIFRIFPSEYIHVGNDESFDLGYCSLCQKKTQEEGLSSLFSLHLSKTHHIITKELGKKMMMWDDMFEVCPESLENLPKDVVLCCWLYDESFDKPYSHFFNRKREDLLAKYDRLGLSYLFCTREQTAGNIINFSRYAAKHNALGGLVTTWEHSATFLYRYFPNIAFAGRLWSGADFQNVEPIFEKVILELFKVDDPLFISAVKNLSYLRPWPRIKKPEGFLRGITSQLEEERAKTAALLIKTLTPFRMKVPLGIPRTVLTNILFDLDEELLQHQLRRLVPELYDKLLVPSKNRSPILKKVMECTGNIESLKKRNEERWKRYRTGIQPNHASRFFEEMAGSFKSILSSIKQGERLWCGILDLYCFLPDRYAAPRTKVLLRFKGSKRWHEIFSGEMKPDFDEQSFYQVSLPVKERREPSVLRLEVWGYGGQGFRFVEMRKAGCCFIPKKVIRTEGLVLDSHHLLFDDYRWAYLGEHDVFRTYHTKGIDKTIHSVELELIKVLP
ncbi:MAG: family 20 glycosylhydrolase [Candidatus Omnitrophota bacterium]